jgi:hypothetical protein
MGLLRGKILRLDGGLHHRGLNGAASDGRDAHGVIIRKGVGQVSISRGRIFMNRRGAPLISTHGRRRAKFRAD